MNLSGRVIPMCRHRKRPVEAEPIHLKQSSLLIRTTEVAGSMNHPAEVQAPRPDRVQDRLAVMIESDGVEDSTASPVLKAHVE